MEYKLILASGSPRRRQLMEGAGFNFELRVKDTPEDYPADMQPEAVPEYLAQKKAVPFKGELKRDELLITADTVVCIGAKILGKPKDREDAIRILHLLSGQKHTVVSGVCLTTVDRTLSFSVKTDVYFRPLKDTEIEYYIDTFKPFDKAGAYGIQEWIGYVGIERIDGSFYNVMGLPIQVVCKYLSEFGVSPAGVSK